MIKASLLRLKQRKNPSTTRREQHQTHKTRALSETAEEGGRQMEGKQLLRGEKKYHLIV